MKSALILFILLCYSMYCLSSYNVTYYPIVPVSTNVMNVSSLKECICRCLTSSDCHYFSYWSSLTSPTCQIYNSSESKPEIGSYVLPNNDNETGFYVVSSSYISCGSSISSSLVNYNNNQSFHSALTGALIVSILIMSIGNESRLLAIDNTNSSYYIIDINTFQIVDIGTLTPSGCLPLCATQYSNLLYIGCTLNIIELRQFVSVSNTSREIPQLLYNYSTSAGGAPQCLAVLNSDILYYVIGTGNLYVYLTKLNINKFLYSFSGVTFASPSFVIALDSINMRLYLSSSNGTLFGLQLSSMNIDNGTSFINSSQSIVKYEMPLNLLTSVFIDQCNRLWVLSSPAGFLMPQMILFIPEDNANISFSTMNVINMTNSLPTNLNSPYNFVLSENYSLFTSNTAQGVYEYFRP